MVLHYWKIIEFWQRHAIRTTSQTWTSSQTNVIFNVFAIPYLIIIEGFVFLTSLANAAHPSCRIKRTKWLAVNLMMMRIIFRKFSNSNQTFIVDPPLASTTKYVFGECNFWGSAKFPPGSTRGTIDSFINFLIFRGSGHHCLCCISMGSFSHEFIHCYTQIIKISVNR
jgi:hypothetical protein